MTFGALLGATFGEGWSYLSAGADKRSCALLGAGAVLAAATQAPISSVAFALELTYNANTLMVPLLIAVAGATLTYHRFESRTSY
jgi:H+/Cl- antiporter ClcA